MNGNEEDALLLDGNDSQFGTDDDLDDRTYVLEQRGVQRGKPMYKIKTNYESLDYELVQSTVRLVEQRKLYSKSTRYDQI